MNILKLEASRIAGTQIVLDAPPQAVSVGIRPEDIQLGGPYSLSVSHTEFTGADLMLHAQAGGQTIVVRAEGSHAARAQSQISLGWDASKLHWFDESGLRI